MSLPLISSQHTKVETTCLQRGSQTGHLPHFGAKSFRISSMPTLGHWAFDEESPAKQGGCGPISGVELKLMVLLAIIYRKLDGRSC